MKRILILAVVIAVLCGCNIRKVFQEEKARNRREWYQARAKILYGVGVEHLKAGSFDKARTSALEAIKLYPDYVPARVLLAKVLLERGDNADAIEQLRRAQTLSPGDAEVAYLLGQALERTGQFIHALKQYQKARALDPARDTYVIASANVLVLMNRPKEALELLDARLTRTTGSPAILLLAGQIAMLNHSPEKAAEFFQRCLDQEPNSLAVRESLAKAEYLCRHYADALSHLKMIDLQLQKRRELRQDNPTLQKQPEVEKSWVYLMMGDCYMALNQPWRARRAYEKACQIEPEDWQVWVRLAKVAVAMGPDYARDAISAARRALGLNNQSIEAAVILAGALLKQSHLINQSNPLPNWQDAISVLTPALRKHPDNPALWCMLGRCFAAGGFHRKAAACYYSALKIDPNNPLAKRLLGRSVIDKKTLTGNLLR